METRIIISQIFMLAVVVLIGAISTRFKVITTEIKDMLSKLIFNISLPLMLFTNFLRIGATPELIANSLAVLGISGFVILLLFIIGWITSRLMKFSIDESAVFMAHSMFGNTIFLGFPLIHALYGSEGLLYATMFQLVSNILMWTVGVVILTQGNGVTWKKNILRVLNPNTIATVAGLVFFMFSLKLPEIIVRPLAELGSANTWLSMLYIGAMLVFANVADLLKTKSLYIISFNRLILAPAILVSVLYIFSEFAGFAPDKLVSSVIILEASMPCMATVVVMAREFGADDRQAVGNVFISTIFSIVTLPLVVMAINRFL
ncbi:MAG: AEC family transporter [Bacteroidales bacterium]|nr:AEC family transporter [Bacteroidales bacterium]